jgi:exopolysaccharide biosynthesis protein
VVDGKVVANRLTDFPPEGSVIKGVWLVARGDKAEDKLQSLKVGSKVTMQRRLAGDIRMAISGNALLLKRRQVLATDDRELHPRTAVGVDRDEKQLIFLVVDGRQDFSRGYTMVELARTLRRLGAEDALNLDGGGSTTLVAQRDGRIRTINHPSDGRQRPVPNGIEIVYRRPAG